MTALRLAWDITRRMALWGFAGGGVLGAIYGPLSILASALLLTLGLGSDSSPGEPSSTMITASMFAGCLLGAADGAILGLMLGIIDGLVLAFITRFVSTSLFFNPLVNSYFYPVNIRNGALIASYPATMAGVSALIGGVGAMLGFSLIMPLWLFSTQGVVGWVLRTAMPAIIAGGWGWWTGNRIASRVEHQRLSGLSPTTS